MKGGPRRRDRLACVMGGMDLVRPLGLAGIPCVPVAPPGSDALYSRFAVDAIPFDDFWDDAAGLLDALLRFGGACRSAPTLFYEQDSQLLLVSRHRERLAGTFRFVVADPVLVEDLVDKGRFQALAERTGLPVPPTRRVTPSALPGPAEIDLRFPVMVKPLTRRETWDALAAEAAPEPGGGVAKALEAGTADALARLWPRLAESGMDFLVQERVPGPETRIESYHVYVDEGGRIAAEFTGRKIRTYPVANGHSTALTISDAAGEASDVRDLGRSVTERLGLRGVAKLDFKRGPDGRLHLLEINPRFNLWHHLGAVAGVNIPAVVHADLDGSPRPGMAAPRAGASWCTLSLDRRAARESGLSAWSWWAWALRCEAKSVVAWDDPMPYVRGKLQRWLDRRRGPGRGSAAAAP